MDKSEVIILSSDDESDTRNLKNRMPQVTVKRVPKKRNEKVETHLINKKTPPINKKQWNNAPLSKDLIITDKNSKKKYLNVSKNNPEVVDLVESLDKSPDVNYVKLQDCGSNGAFELMQSNSKLDVIDIDAKENNTDKGSSNESNDNEKPEKLLESLTADSNHEATTQMVRNVIKPVKIGNVPAENNVHVVENNTHFNNNLNFFTQFVEFCGSLETIPNDRIRLTKKLMKRYGEAEPSYVESQEFRDLIQKCREKVNAHNLYLIAKNVTAELSFRKQIEVICIEGKNIPTKDENEGKTEAEEEMGDKKLKKRAKFIKKIFKKLEEMGNKIRELELEEVDLSDEEESSYVRLQRYRERYYMIYKRLCKYTNEIPDLDQLYNHKICFAESKYPTINKCIEVWLNKIKRFPDFTDIMKLLESQSSSLGLPSNRESLRAIAIEIFQQVGAMLQRRRKYDLWDSFCGFLGSEIDPAVSDPTLDKVLQEHLEIRIKKEQEIFQHYSELQESERLEPEEVPDEEANESPVESGNEDEMEIEEIENNLLERLDLSTEEDGEKEGGDESDSVDKTKPERKKEQKESKNNYKNCKSLRWRSENLRKSKSESGNSEESDLGPELDKEVPELEEKSSLRWDEDLMAMEESCKIDSDLEVLEEEVHRDTSTDKELKNGAEVRVGNKTLLKRSAISVEKSPGKKKCINYWENGESDSMGKLNETFNVQYCQVFTDSVFECFSESKKDGEKRKVFRDMTNVNRLMKLHGKNLNASGWFTPSLFRPVFRESVKPSWKRRFKVSFQMVGSKNEKCALNHEEKTGNEDGKGMKSNPRRGSAGENNQNDSGRGRDERDGFFGGHRDGSHEDDDKDRNRKNGRTKNDVGESKPEEEEEDEDEKDEGEADTKTKTSEHSLKTEERQESNAKTEWPLEVLISKNETASLNLSEILTNGRKLRKTIEKTIEKNEEVEILEEKIDGKILEIKEEIEIQEKSKEIEQESSELDNSQDKNAKKYFFRSKNDKESTEKVSKPETKANTDEVIEIDKPVGSTTRKHQWRSLNQEVGAKKENKINKVKPQESDLDRAATSRKSLPLEILLKEMKKKRSPSASDEERVKRFLMHSPSSISITPPRNLAFSKPPSDAALKALATLRKLKGISATIVKGKPKDEDDVMIIGDLRDQRRDSGNSSKLPVISNVESIYGTTPKIVTVEGNVSGFENNSEAVTGGEKSECNSSFIKISNVWGNLPNNFMQAVDSESVRPGRKSENSQLSSKNSVKKGNSTKKKVEYVVIE